MARRATVGAVKCILIDELKRLNQEVRWLLVETNDKAEEAVSKQPLGYG